MQLCCESYANNEVSGKTTAEFKCSRQAKVVEEDQCCKRYTHGSRLWNKLQDICFLQKSVRAVDLTQSPSSKSVLIQTISRIERASAWLRTVQNIILSIWNSLFCLPIVIFPQSLSFHFVQCSAGRQ